MSERRERSFLRRARDVHDEVDPEPSGDRPPIEDSAQATDGEPNVGGREADPTPGGAERPEPAEPGGYRRGAELRRSIALAAERVDEIITTAHQMAEEIRHEAEAEADRLVEIRRREADLLAEERLASVRAALGTLRVEIDQIERRVLDAARGSKPAPAPPTPPAVEPQEPPATPRVVRPAAYPGTGGEPTGRARPHQRWADQRAAALIRASQLAVQGEGRERIETVLRDDFGIEQPAEIVDEVLPRPR